MNTKFSFRDADNISRIATIVIFLALIRCISEPFRLNYYATVPIRFNDIKPFLTGALIGAIGLLVMIIFSYFHKYKMVIAICILTIIILLIIKKIYLVP